MNAARHALVWILGAAISAAGLWVVAASALTNR